jgi:hypothetical protein
VCKCEQSEFIEAGIMFGRPWHDEAEKQIKAAFDSHECRRKDASQNVPARVSGYTEET